MFKIFYKSSVEKDLRSIGSKDQLRIIEIIEKKLRIDPYQGKSLKGRFRPCRRIRIGDFRVIYTIDEDSIIVLILRVRHRKDVYRGIL